ncbi:hypothetical protein [Oceaniglobus roseus]|uniref:hypothetical protein n=1 Tax=Oceaniglobus roseus TaxID=1737570 RepID=UPI000C7E9B09|nr:hypothetical protein [Kandeliimicrobium roseum]
MGVSLIPAMFLARNARHVTATGTGLILGRQRIHMPERTLDRFVAAATLHGFRLSREEITQPDGFTETLFAALGYPAMQAMDFTAKEGAEHIRDLNRPVPASLHEAFDVVIDGGTTEHIFYIAQALDSCHAMLKPGGVMLSYVACDGWFGHGFFQTGPDVPWRYWHHARGYEMLEVSVVARRHPRKIVPIPDPTGRHRGGEMAFSGPQMLLYACRKPLEAPPYSPPIQGHYA